MYHCPLKVEGKSEVVNPFFVVKTKGEYISWSRKYNLGALEAREGYCAFLEYNITNIFQAQQV